VLGNTEFALSDEFKNVMSKALNINIPSKNVFVAMDYHLDWVYGSLKLFSENIDTEETRLYSRFDQFNNEMIQGTQEDSDLLICYKEYEKYHIILIEAKGVMPWNCEQLYSKIKRLKDIFDTDGLKWKSVIPHFMVISSRKLPCIDYDKFPEWALENGRLIELCLNIPHNLIKITRCNENLYNDKNGEFWKIDYVKSHERRNKRILKEYNISGIEKINVNNHGQGWINVFTEKYLDNLANLRIIFFEAYKFLKDISKLERFKFHMGTAVNMHFYYKDRFLFYFKFHGHMHIPGSPVKFSPNYNLQLKHDAQVYSPETFFKPLLSKISKSELFSKGKIERPIKGYYEKSDLCDLYVYPSEESKIFFNYCREVLAEISNHKLHELFPGEI